MKVAITTQDNDIDALVDPRFGRAAWFIIVDPESEEWTAVDNRANADAGAVITGNVGPNAHRTLAAAGVSVYQAGNGVTAREALRRYKAQELPVVTTPTVAGHWS